MTGRMEDSVIEVYQRHGSAWAASRDERLPEISWLDRFCRLMPSRGTVLDIGCGSGTPIARELIRRGLDVTLRPPNHLADPPTRMIGPRLPHP
jgi:SAM-dependent methyltransferase